MDLIKYGWDWLTFLLHRLNTITTNHSILHTPFMAPSASLWRWWTCKTKRPAWTQEYSVHVCSMLNNVELWHTVVITIQFQCHVVSADCTCKMELLLPVRMQNLPIKSAGPKLIPGSHGPPPERPPSCPVPTCNGSQSQMSQHPIRPISDSQTNNI